MLQLGAAAAASTPMIGQPQRQFAAGFATPMSKLRHIVHPRYGKVFPVVTISRKNEWPRLRRISTTSLSVVNFSIMWSALIMPIYTAEASAILANPFFLLPSIALNYYLYKSSYALFYMDRSMITNIFLMDNGKQIITETRDGKTKVINIMDIYQ